MTTAPPGIGHDSIAADDRITWRDRLATPLSDAVRGRWRLRRTLHRALDAAGLPPLLRRLIEDVVRRTRLWPSERLEIADELIAHFADGLDAGRTPESLAAAFGEPRQAARLMRRAKKRNRPLWWRSARNVQRGTAATIALLIGLYAVLCIRFWTGSPNPRIDYRPKLNASALAVGESDRAWPLYREALIKLGESPDAMDPLTTLSRSPRPGETHWEIWETHLMAKADALDLARQASAKPGMGLVTGYELSADDRRLFPKHVFSQREIDEYGLLSVMLPHYQPLRQLARALATDAQRAAAAGDGETVAADIEALLGLAQHSRETPLLVSDLVSLAIFHLATNSLMDVLASWPAALSDGQLQRLAHRLGEVSDDDLRVSFAGERMGFEDLIQRTYTEGGPGGGRLTPRGAKLLMDWTNGSDRWEDELTALAIPAVSAIALGRGELLADYHRMMDLAEREGSMPLWQREDSRFERQIEEWHSSKVESVRRWPLVAMMPAIFKATVNAELAMARRDAALAALAIELHGRRYGSPPASLDEPVPSWLPKLPIDRFSGKPLKYLVRDDGQTVLYSVGTDREDDGGRPSVDYNGIAANAAAARWMSVETLKTREATPTNPGSRAGVHWLPDGDWILWPPEIEPLVVSPPPEQASHLPLPS